MVNLQMCYLLLFPFEQSSPLGPLVSIPAPKDSPYFYELDIELRSSWGERTMMIGDTAVRIQLQVFDGIVWVAECHYELPDGVSAEGNVRNQEIKSQLRHHLMKETGTSSTLLEEYTIVVIPNRKEGDSASLVEENTAELAHLLRSLHKPLRLEDAAEVLNGRVRFSKQDLTIVDWSGAILACECDDAQSDIELLKIGKYQILRYRLLDQTIHEMLTGLRSAMPARFGRFPSARKTVVAITNQRLSLLLDFEKIDQSLLLIGDWYSAQLYQLIVDQFDLREWKSLVHDKLNQLSDINQVIQDNLAFSWRRTIDFIVFVGWFVMMVGYLILFIGDMS